MSKHHAERDEEEEEENSGINSRLCGSSLMKREYVEKSIAQDS